MVFLSKENILKPSSLQHNDEISISVNVVKTEKRTWIAYAERLRAGKNRESAAKPRTEEGSTTIRRGGVALILHKMRSGEQLNRERQF